MPAQNGYVSILYTLPLIGHQEPSDWPLYWPLIGQDVALDSRLVINEPSPQSLLIGCISSVR